jgi:hypothetical protein
MRTGSAGASHEVSLAPFGVRWSRRTAWSFACSKPSRFGVVPASAPTPGGRFAHAVFSASRLALLFSCVRCQTPPRGSFVADFFRASVPDPRRLLSRPDRDRQSPGDVHGIYLLPFAVLLPPAGDDVSSTSRAHMPFCHLPPRVSSSRGPPRVTVGREFVAAAPGVWPRERTVPCDLPAPL